jgi:hypothetical protein
MLQLMAPTNDDRPSPSPALFRRHARAGGHPVVLDSRFRGNDDEATRQLRNPGSVNGRGADQTTRFRRTGW